MWQEIAIIIIGIAVVSYVLWKIYKFITISKNTNSPCSSCSGCALKDQIKERKECSEKNNKATVG